MTEIPMAAQIRAAIEAKMRLLSLPRITEDEWDDRFGWRPHAYGDCELLEDSPEIQALLTQFDPHHVWTLVDIDDGEFIVPGFQNGFGWYLCDRPWSDDDIMAVALSDADSD